MARVCDDCGSTDAERYVKGKCINCYQRDYMRSYRGSNLNRRCGAKDCKRGALLIPGKLRLCAQHFHDFYGVDPAA